MVLMIMHFSLCSAVGYSIYFMALRLASLQRFLPVSSVVNTGKGSSQTQTPLYDASYPSSVVTTGKGSPKTQTLLYSASFRCISLSRSVINVGIGIAIFSETFSRFAPSLTIFYVYLGWIVFFIVVIFVLFLLFSVLSFTSQDEGKG